MGTRSVSTCSMAKLNFGDYHSNNSDSIVGTIMHANELSNVLQEYDCESYDDAFFREVEEKEEVYKSPLKLTTSMESSAHTLIRKTSILCAFEAEARRGRSFRKLDYMDDRRSKLTTWYDKMVLCGGEQPSLEYLEALGTLSKEKVLLLLTYFPKGGWDKALPFDELRGYASKDMSLPEMDSRVRYYAEFYSSSNQKALTVDWSRQEKSSHIVFHCEVMSEGLQVFKGPYLEQSSSPLQRVFGDAGVLRVHFADHKNIQEVEGRYRRVAREGIWVGLRHYMFFAFKDPKSKKKQGLEDTSSLPKCFFVCTDSLAKADYEDPNFRQFKDVSEAQRYMMHIENVHTFSKKFSRLQLALSQTLPIWDLNDTDANVVVTDDIYCRDEDGKIVKDSNGEPLIHTDGTGFISRDIAARCPPHVYKGKKVTKYEDYDQEYPLLLQVRVFYKGTVAKGTLLVNLKLPPKTIVLRKSMVKVTSNLDNLTPQYNSLELCATSRKPVHAKTFQHLTLLLTYGGVPESVFLKYLEEEVEEAVSRFRNRTAALSALKNSEQDDLNDTAIRMLAADIPLHDPYLQKTLWDATKSTLQDLSKARISIPYCFNLMGCADPTGKLKRNQVTVVLEQGPVYRPKVIVYKPPGLHAGDAKVFEATWYKEFEEIIGNGKFVIFFSTQGPRSVVDEIANSDLDGDQYWVCLNPQVVEHFRPAEVWQNPGTKKNASQESESSGNDEVFHRLHFEAYLKARFRPSSTMGIAANSWLALMDKYLTTPDNKSEDKRAMWLCIQSLVNTYYEAVDAEKTGVQVSVKAKDRAKCWPHYMEKMDKDHKEKWIVSDSEYRSSSILGKIYDFIKGCCETVDFVSSLGKMVHENTFIDTSFQYDGYSEYYQVWDKHFSEYKQQIKECLNGYESEQRNAQIENLFQKYRQELYKADTLIDSQEPIDKIYKQASAVYIVVYTNAYKKLLSLKVQDYVEHAQKLGLQFAWRVAGYALFRLYHRRNAVTKRKEPIFVEESVFRDFRITKKRCSQ